MKKPERSIKVLIPVEIQVVGQPGDVILDRHRGTVPFRLSRREFAKVEEEARRKGNVLESAVIDYFTKRANQLAFSKFATSELEAMYPGFTPITIRAELVGAIIWPN